LRRALDGRIGAHNRRTDALKPPLGADSQSAQILHFEADAADFYFGFVSLEQLH
jgi:hypothetical protein